jgi:hypothetical protein
MVVPLAAVEIPDSLDRPGGYRYDTLVARRAKQKAMRMRGSFDALTETKISVSDI